MDAYSMLGLFRAFESAACPVLSIKESGYFKAMYGDLSSTRLRMLRAQLCSWLNKCICRFHVF